MRGGGIFGPMPPKKYEAPIDTSRPILRNADKSISTERTITIGVPGGYVILPTIVGGHQVTPDQAVALWRVGRNPHVGYRVRSRRVGKAKTEWQLDAIGPKRSQTTNLTCF